MYFSIFEIFMLNLLSIKRSMYLLKDLSTSTVMKGIEEKYFQIFKAPNFRNSWYYVVN